MSTHVRGKQYWGEKQERLCQQWLSADTKQQFQIYKGLLPALNQMSEMIMNRYFAVPTSQRQTELKKDAIQELFLKLHLYHPDKVKNKNGAYSFCSMIIKHYFYEVLVAQPTWVKQIEKRFVYIDEYDEYVKPLEYAEKPKIDYNRLLSHFKTLKLKVEREYAKALKNAKRKVIPKKYKHKIEIVELTCEFIEKFDSFNGAAVVDYIYLNQKSGELLKSTIAYYFRQTFGMNINVGVNLEGKNDIDWKVDLRRNNRISYIQDDTPPNESIHAKRGREKTTKKNHPEIDLYRYF